MKLHEITPSTSQKLLKGNYARLFDAARIKVHAWEKQHANDPGTTPPATHRVAMAQNKYCIIAHKYCNEKIPFDI